MRYVIIDTSSMLFGFSFNRNVFEAATREFPGFRLLVSRGIVGELRRISLERGKKGLRAKIALIELRAKKIDVDNISKHADSWILEKSANSIGSVVITNDTALAERLALQNTRAYKMSRSGMLKLFHD